MPFINYLCVLLSSREGVMGLKRDLIVLSAMILTLVTFTLAWSINDSSRDYSSAEAIDVGAQTAVTIIPNPFIAQGNHQIALTVTLQNSAITSKTVTMYIYPLDSNGDVISGCTPENVTKADIVISAGGTSVFSYTFTKTYLRFEIKAFQIILDDTTSGILQSVTFNEKGTANAPKAIVAYTNATVYPDYRMYELSWSAERKANIAATSNTQIAEVRVAYNPVTLMRDTMVVVSLNTAGYIDGYTYDGSTWTMTNLGRIGTYVQSGTRPFDVAYENSTGRAVVVYNNQGTNGARDLAYRIWDGQNWSAEAYIDDTSSTSKRNYYWVQLASKMTGGSTEIALVGLNSVRYSNAWIWSGSSWGTMQALNDASNLVTSGLYEGCAIAYEYTTGDLVALSSSGLNVRYYKYTGSWSAVTSLAMGSGNVRYMTLKSHKVVSSNRMMLLTLDSNTDIYARSWDGSSWGASTVLDATVASNTRRCIDGDWEPTGTKFIAVGGDSAVTSISYKTWTPAGGWSPSTSGSWNTFAGLTKAQYWIQVRMNPKAADPMVLIGTVDFDSDLVITTWTGSAMSNQIEATTNGVSTFESFDIEFTWPEPVS
jgi:hypothetical protein